SSLVTDSAAASSSWGGGHRIPNGGINIGRGGIEHQPIWQKFINAGKKAGIVTTVYATHATPAGFCVNSKSRNDQDGIAEKYLKLDLQVIMGGGQRYFDPKFRADNKDLYAAFRSKNYNIVKVRDELNSINNNQPLLGLFCEGALPYEIDRQSNKDLYKHVPTLKEMTEVALEHLKGSANGFVLQVEAGKVDWAAHANDAAGLLYDQMAFDDAIEVAIKFAEEDGETLVVITTDHGNANPGMMYGKNVNENFDRLQTFKYTNEWILNNLTKDDSTTKVQDIIKEANNYTISNKQALFILDYYKNLEKLETGLYNYKNLPFKLLSIMQQDYHSIGWISDNHSGDYVELAAYGPGSHLLKGFMKNTELHYMLLEACDVAD
ncbi:alkaline phosphatase, partial [Paucihalobacter sp.]|uniref:alkaline phosphatase n=2 Tax=Paucihalobacter sp. TaxID=2850405 RepID=UPI003D160AE3